MAKYGMPYMGSKSGIAEKIIDILPKAPVLYDLFGGGGAISHCAVLSGKWRKVVYNDINKVIVDGFRTAINGGFKDEKRWISRKEFHRLRKYDPYVHICFSFGNNGKGYAYGPDLENYKKALHKAVVCCEYDLYEKITGINFEKYFKGLSLNDRRLKAKEIILEKKEEIEQRIDLQNKRNYELQHMEALNRLQHMEALNRLQHRIQFRNVDYRTVPINEKGIIYCDIPYENTAEYVAGAFDHDKFYKWVAEQELPVYVSSYEINRPNFRCIGAIEKKQTLASFNNSKTIKERVYRYIK